MPALDGLRGIAIALVVAVHYFGLPYGGILGVDLFFVLSGFLITTLLLEEHTERGRVSLRRFYERRARRLFPALAVMLATFLVLGGGLKVTLLGGLYISNILRAFGIAPEVAASPLTHLWSLAQEEQFYLIWPLVLLFLVRMRRIVPILGCLLAVLVVYRLGLVLSGASYDRVAYGPDTHADGLVAGSMLAVIRFKREVFAVPEWVGKAGGAVLLAAVILRQDGPGWNAYGLPIAEAACVCLVAAAVAQTELAGVLSAKPLVWLGRVSYSLYIWHLLVIWTGLRPAILDVPVALVVAWLSYRLVEQPFRRRRVRPESVVPEPQVANALS